MGILAEERAGAEMLATMIMTVGIVGLSVLIVISVRAKIARRNESRRSPRELIEELKARPAAAPRDDATADAAHMIEAIGRLAAQLDNKCQRLEILLGQADERLAALEEAGAGTDAPAAPPPAPAPTGELPCDPLVRAVYDLADRGRSPLEIARELDEQVGKIELILALRAA